MTAKDFFLENKDSLAEFVSKISVSNETTMLKYGTIDNENISINFFVNGQIDESITDYEEKVNHLFDTNADISGLNEEIQKVIKPFKISFIEPVRINENPAIHASQLTIFYNEGLV